MISEQALAFEDWEPRRQWLELISWHLVTQIKRHHPKRFSIIEMHPGGGQYDCLGLFSGGRGVHAMFNRPGSLAIPIRFDTHEPGSGVPFLWSRLAVESPDTVLSDVMNAIGLEPVAKPPTSAPEVLTYRVMAALLRLYSMSLETRQWRSAYEDTSGYGGGWRNAWINQFKDLGPHLRTRLPGDVLDEPAYRFWFLVNGSGGSGEPLVCVQTTGVVHLQDGSEINLMDVYNKSGRNLWATVIRGLHMVLPVT